MMDEFNKKVFRRNINTINSTLEHILEKDNISKDIIEDYFKVIRETVNFSEELALDEEN